MGIWPTVVGPCSAQYSAWHSGEMPKWVYQARMSKSCDWSAGLLLHWIYSSKLWTSGVSVQRSALHCWSCCGVMFFMSPRSQY